MEIDRLKTMSAEDRKAVLETEALSVEETAYHKPLTEDEILFYKDELSMASIKQATLLEDLQRVKDEYKLKLDPIKRKIAESLLAVRHRVVEKHGKLYTIPDYDTNHVNIIDADGNVINTRRMVPEERQYRMSINLNREAI